jgi:hypothetical protein
MAEQKEFETIDEMYNYVVDSWNCLGFGILFLKENLSITDDLGKDERINWKETRYVCTDCMGEDSYETPQCIGMCSIE